MRVGIFMAFGSLVLFGVLGSPVIDAGQKKTPDKKHKHLHHALRELHHAHHELKESKEDYAGHKEKALKSIHEAAKNIEAILTHEKETVAAKPTEHKTHDAHKKYSHHPFLHHALHELKAAHKDVEESKDKFGGHRDKALKAMHHAIHDIELILMHAKAAKTEKTK